MFKNILVAIDLADDTQNDKLITNLTLYFFWPAICVI